MFRKKALSQGLTCKIGHLVPEEDFEINCAMSSTGQDIFDDVVKQLDLLDKEYFGLKFKYTGAWLDLTKSILKQLDSQSISRSTSPVISPLYNSAPDTSTADSHAEVSQQNVSLSNQTCSSSTSSNIVELELRFKFYPADQALLRNETTRYYLYLQLRFDLIDGRLYTTSQDTLAYLIASVLQSELGDYVCDSKTISTNYVAEFKFVPNQNQSLELAAIDLHKSEDFQGLSPSEAEVNFLKKACQLDRYGIDPFPVKDMSSQNFIIGVNHRGLSTFEEYKKINEFLWEDIFNMHPSRKHVTIQCYKRDKHGNKTSKSGTMFDFRFASKDESFNFWKLATEHRFFFTLETTPDRPLVVKRSGSFFNKSYKLKYDLKVERDVLSQSLDEGARCNSGLKRSHSLMLRNQDGGSKWKGFEQGQDMQTSLTNVFSSKDCNNTNTNFANKTLPTSMNYLREVDEEDDDDNETIGGGSSKILSEGLGKRGSQQLKPFNKRSLNSTSQQQSSGDFDVNSSLSNNKNHYLQQQQQQKQQPYLQPQQQRRQAQYESYQSPISELIKTNVFFVLVTTIIVLTIAALLSNPSSLKQLHLDALVGRVSGAVDRLMRGKGASNS